MTRILNCDTQSQPVECVLQRQHGFNFLMVNLDTNKESKFLILFGMSSHIYVAKNGSDSVQYLTTRTRRVKNARLFRILYTEFCFNGKKIIQNFV